MAYSVLCMWYDTISSVEPCTDDIINQNSPPPEDIIHINTLRHHSTLDDDITSLCVVKECSVNGDILNICIISELNKHNSDGGSIRNSSASPCSQVISYGQISVLQLDVMLADLVMRQLRVSSVFQQGFCGYVSDNNVRSRHLYQRPCEHVGSVSTNCTMALVPQLVIVRLSWPCRCLLDYKWSYRVISLVMKAIQLDDAMNWLNTLGGGYSALGDNSFVHAEQAGRISFSQMSIAMEMGDPATVIRCRLYFSLSLMQTRYLQRAKYIIRRCYHDAQELLIIDARLLAMCKGIWSRLRYLYTNRRGVHYNINYTVPPLCDRENRYQN